MMSIVEANLLGKKLGINPDILNGIMKVSSVEIDVVWKYGYYRESNGIETYIQKDISTNSK